MKYFNKFTIKQRFLMMVCFSILFFVGFSSYAIYGITKINKLVDTLIEHPLKVSNSALEAQLSAMELRDLIMDGVLNYERNNPQQLVGEFHDKEKELKTYLEEINESIMEEEDQTLANEATDLVNEWLVEQNRTLQYLQNGQLDEARQHFNEGEEEYSAKVFSKIHELNHYAKNNAETHREEADNNQAEHIDMLAIFMAGFTLILLSMSYFTNRNIFFSIQKLKQAMTDSGTNNRFVEVEIEGKSEIAQMSKDYNKMIHFIGEQFYVIDGQTKLNEQLSGEITVHALGDRVIQFLAEYIHAGKGVFYLFDKEEQALKLISSYAFTEREYLGNSFRLGQGIIGQVGLEQKPILLKNIKKKDMVITTGTVSEAPLNAFTFPLVYEKELYGVIEFASFEPFDQVTQQFLLEAGKIISINLFTAIQSEKIKVLLQETQDSNKKLEEQQHMLEKQAEDITEQNHKLKALLEKSQQQAEELQVQQEELRQTNEELEQQTEVLRLSEEKLQTQQEELKVSNEELEERTKILEKQKQSIEDKNKELILAQKEIEEKAEQLEITSKYKSEFLANMSHELRTPLNSILVLSQLLSEKEDTTPLTEKQLQFAKTIHSSGQDLIRLINDILDLSKVEAGRLHIEVKPIKLKEIVTSIERQFSEVAAQKGLKVDIEIDENIPNSITSDRQRLEQIIKNLMSNGIKFTENGRVSLKIDRPTRKEAQNAGLDENQAIRFVIADTGIGIPKDRQRIIFEAFQQVDGTISRRYGGTGLGLSISRELTKLLQGQITLKSEEGVGSAFTLVIPESYMDKNEQASFPHQEGIEGEIPSVELESNKNIAESPQMKDEQKSLLIIDDDQTFINILTDIADSKNFHYFFATDGETGFRLAKEKAPTAIILDIQLPDMNGWDVLAKLQADEATKDIPVHVISGSENLQSDKKKKGIVSYLQKPVKLEELNATFNRLVPVLNKSFKNILIADDDQKVANSISEFLRERGMAATVVSSEKEAYESIRKERFDAIIFELELQEGSNISLLERISGDPLLNIPIIIHTRKHISPTEEEQLKSYTSSIILKGERSKDRVQAEVTLFLHGVNSGLTRLKQKEVKSNQTREGLLEGKKVLLVDDDMRNIFAITSLLENKGIKVIHAKNGKEGINRLIENEDTDLVLMDIMMPEMDGYTAMKEIRRLEKVNKVPIIALTAKAMKEDRIKCIEAGANDYLTKPVDNTKLLSLLRVWLYK